MAEMTPMMRQYMEIKEQNKDSILFFRLGDFYEMFGDDARKASRELDLTLTTRDKDKNKSFEEKIPMCGIPYHASDAKNARRQLAKTMKLSRRTAGIPSFPQNVSMAATGASNSSRGSVSTFHSFLAARRKKRATAWRQAVTAGMASARFSFASCDSGGKNSREIDQSA